MPINTPPITDFDIQKCSMNENNTLKTMLFQKIFVSLQNPRKDSGLHCLLPALRTEVQLLLPSNIVTLV